MENCHYDESSLGDWLILTMVVQGRPFCRGWQLFCSSLARMRSNYLVAWMPAPAHCPSFQLSDISALVLCRCCCSPAWINYVEKLRPDLIPHLSTAKSPMGVSPTHNWFFKFELNEILRERRAPACMQVQVPVPQLHAPPLPRC